VRALENGDMRKTQLVMDGPHAEALAQEWRDKAGAAGWTAVSAPAGRYVFVFVAFSRR